MGASKSTNKRQSKEKANIQKEAILEYNAIQLLKMK